MAYFPQRAPNPRSPIPPLLDDPRAVIAHSALGSAIGLVSFAAQPCSVSTRHARLTAQRGSVPAHHTIICLTAPSWPTSVIVITHTAVRLSSGPPTSSFCCTSHHVSRLTAPTRQGIVYNCSLFTDTGLSVPPKHQPGYNHRSLRTIHSIRRSLNEIFCFLYRVPPVTCLAPETPPARLMPRYF